MSRRACHLGVTVESATKDHLVKVTAPTADADADWWTQAAASKAWVVQHLARDGVDLVQATRRCRHAAHARATAERTRRQINRSLDRLYLNTTTTNKES